MTLQDMLDDAPDKVDSTQSSLDQINAQILDISEQIESLESGICNNISSDSTGELALYLDATKVIELEIQYGGTYGTPFSVEYGTNYGQIDYEHGGVTDFRVVDSTGNSVYEYLGALWDNDPIITAFVEDYAFANDYLTRPLTSGATYGLKPTRTALLTAKSILEENKALYEDSEDVLSRYV